MKLYLLACLLLCGLVSNRPRTVLVHGPGVGDPWLRGSLPGASQEPGLSLGEVNLLQ